MVFRPFIELMINPFSLEKKKSNVLPLKQSIKYFEFNKQDFFSSSVLIPLNNLGRVWGEENTYGKFLL